MSADAERENTPAAEQFEADKVRVSIWTGSSKGDAQPRWSVMATDRATEDDVARVVALVGAAFKATKKNATAGL